MKMSDRVYSLNRHYEKVDTLELLKDLEANFPSLTLVSSFGAESAVLLHLISLISVKIPVIFIETGKLFKQTIEYKNTLEKHLSLKNIQIFGPNPELIDKHDPTGNTHLKNTGLCCYVRKVEPLERALMNTNIWISGRKKFQSEARENLPLFEIDDTRIKVNPLANWTKELIDNYYNENNLPEHPLVKNNYLSIGCFPCTTAVKSGEDLRSGRWRGQEKTECGIHANGISI